MDAGAFVQENKRWLIGVAVGAVAWLVASTVIDSLHDPRWPSGAAPGPMLDQAAAAAARTENEQLRAERERLQAALAFVPTERYLLDNKPSADSYLFGIARELRQTIQAAALQRGVQVTEARIAAASDSAGSADERRATLFGLELMDEFQQRLFAAHDARRRADEFAIGLTELTSLLHQKKAARPAVRGARAGEIVLGDFLTQEAVTFEFKADEATAMAFYESCPKPDRNLVVDVWKLEKPAKVGDPCSVKGTLVGIVFKDKGK